MIFDWVSSFEAAVVIILVLFTFFVRPVKVSGDSMLNTLCDGDWVAVSSINLNFSHGDIVIVNQKNNPYEPLIKRIIAMEGDIIDFHEDTNEVYVKRVGDDDFVLLEEVYIRDIASERHSLYDMQFPYVVDEDCVFVMGDNRNDSKDSRMTEVGVIEMKEIMGKATFRIIPVGKGNIYSNYERDKVYGAE